VQAIINCSIAFFLFCGATSCWKKEEVVVAAPAADLRKKELLTQIKI
jgi:hypothetical protein